MRSERTMLLEGAEAIYTCQDGDGTALRGGYVLLRGPLIERVGDGAYDGPEPDERIDLSGCLVTPGLINTHHHFFQTVTRAVPRMLSTSIMDWLYGMYPLWAGLDEEAVYWSALASSAELLLTGATTAVDMAYLMPERAGELVDAEMQAIREAGLRFHLMRGCMPTIEGDLEQRLGSVMGSDLSRILDDETTIFDRMAYAIDRYHDSSAGSMSRVDVGPTGVTYAKPDFMRRIAEFAADHGCGLHTHFHPRPDERDSTKTGFPGAPLDLLRDSGWLREGTWFAHCTQLTDAEIAAFAEAGVGVSHCPRCVMRVGLPVTRVGAMRAAGVAVGIGVDGGASNDCGAMLNEVRLALVLHRVDSRNRGEEPERWLTPGDALVMATRDGARLLRRDDIGVLAPGKRADVAAFRIDRVGTAGAVADPLAALLMAGADPYAALTVVDGRVRVRDGRLIDLDEARIVAGANQVATRLMERAERTTGVDFRRPAPRGG